MSEAGQVPAVAKAGFRYADRGGASIAVTGPGRNPLLKARSFAGISSIVAGAIGLISVIVARHGESLRGAASSWLLTTADRLGFIRNPPAGRLDEAKVPRLWSFTDQTALDMVLGLGVLLGVAAVLLAVWAAVRREHSLHLGAGLVCGGLGLAAADNVAGMGALLLGAVLVLAVRRTD